MGFSLKSSEKSLFLRYALLSGMGYFMDGYNLTVIAVFTFIIETYKTMPYTPLQIGFASGSALLGAMFGALIFGRYSDLAGRKYIYSFYLAFFIVFPILGAVSGNINEVIIFRFLLGIGIGADYAIGPVYSTEMIPDHVRGTGYGLVWAFWSLGASLTFVPGYIGFIYMGVNAWRLAFAIISIPAVIVLVYRLGVPESIRWEKAGIKSRMDSAYGSSDVSTLPPGVSGNNAHRTNSSIFELFHGDYGKRTAIIWIQWILLDIGSYGFALYAPLLIGTFGIFGSETFIISAILYAVGFVGALISMSWNDRFGRRSLQVMGFGLMSLGMALMAIALDLHGLLILVFGMAGLLLWYVIENIGPGNTVGLYAIELLPTKLRSTSMGSATAVTRFVSFLSAFEFPFIAASLGNAWFFYILLIVMLGAFIFTILFTPETRGITLDQMEDSVYRLHRIIPRQK